MTKKDEYLEKEFNFEKAIKNPYAKELKRQVTININSNSKQKWPMEIR